MLLMNQLKVETSLTTKSVTATRSIKNYVSQRSNPSSAYNQNIYTFFKQLRDKQMNNVKIFEDPSKTGHVANQLLHTHVVYFDKRRNRQTESTSKKEKNLSRPKRQISALSVASKMMKKTETARRTVSNETFKKLQKIGYFLTRIL